MRWLVIALQPEAQVSQRYCPTDKHGSRAESSETEAVNVSHTLNLWPSNKVDVCGYKGPSQGFIILKTDYAARGSYHCYI